MGLESATTIAGLNENWPLGTDPKSQGDDHIRMIKRVLKNTTTAGGEFVKKVGDTMTGNLVLPVGANTTGLQFGPSSGSPAYLAVNSLGNMVVSPPDEGALQYGGATGGPDDAPFVSSLMSRKMSDNRYLQKVNALANGPFTFGPGGTISSLQTLRLIPPAFNSSNFGLVVVGPDTATITFAARGDGRVSVGPTTYGATTAAAANQVVDSAGYLSRSTSSRAVKTDVEAISAPEAILGALAPVYFRSLLEGDQARRFAGFIAEEVAEVMPEASADEGTNYDHRALLAVTVAALQGAMARIAVLEERLGS